MLQICFRGSDSGILFCNFCLSLSVRVRKCVAKSAACARVRGGRVLFPSRVAVVPGAVKVLILWVSGSVS